MIYALFTLPIRSTRSNPIMRPGADLACSAGAVGTVYFGRHHSGFLPENFWHVKNIRVGIVLQKAREAIENKSRISWVEVGSVEKRSCRDLPISRLKYLQIRTRSARPQFDHYPLLTRSTRFILKPMFRSRDLYTTVLDRSQIQTRSLSISLDRYPILHDHYSIILDRYSSVPDRYPTLQKRTDLEYVPSKKGAKIKLVEYCSCKNRVLIELFENRS